MRVFVTGANGQLGQDAVQELLGRGHEVIASGRQTAYAGESSCAYVPLDLTDGDAVFKTVKTLRPQAVLHCAAWTAVDAAEDTPESAEAVNAVGTRVLAEACREADARLLYLSTDYVFDGQGSAPWRPDSSPHPLNVYGMTKLEGERAVRDTLKKYVIVRTAWVFGARGKNFIQTMLEIGRSRKEVRVVDDQICAPTYTRDLARLLADMVETEKYGCYHAVNSGGFVSRCDLCRELYRQAGLETKVIPVATAEFGAARSVRPLNSRLDCSKLKEQGFVPLPHWKDALYRFLSETGQAVPTSRPTEEQAKAVPVLMYHWFYDLERGIVPNDSGWNWISAREFEAQMQYLRDEGYYFASWEELRSWLDGELELPRKTVLLTDDDAYRTFFTVALPIAQKYGVPFTSFVPTSLLADQPELLRTYKAAPYLSFQSHSDALHDHWNICFEKSFSELEADVRRSVEQIGCCDVFAYPFGQYTPEYIAALRLCGFSMAFTTEEGPVRRGKNPYALPRVRIRRGMTVRDFANAIGGEAPRVCEAPSDAVPVRR